MESKKVYRDYQIEDDGENYVIFYRYGFGRIAHVGDVRYDAGTWIALIASTENLPESDMSVIHTGKNRARAIGELWLAVDQAFCPERSRDEAY
jgi:hypothetical protein